MRPEAEMPPWWWWWSVTRVIEWRGGEAGEVRKKTRTKPVGPGVGEVGGLCG
jgi:hypothetical protein